jgi:predicted DCC family thiol-disulfide oxidoreductase YuxK
MSDGPVILFDGTCLLCQGAVQFVLRRDRDRVFRFGSLQSAAGRKLLERHGVYDPGLDSVVLLEDGAAYTESEAALRIARRFHGGWRLLAGFRILPRGLRDALYRWVARHRERWFGRSDACMMPPPGERERFLDETLPDEAKND